MRTKVPDPPTPEPVKPPQKTVAEEGTVKKDFAVDPATGKMKRRRMGLRGLRVEQPSLQPQNNQG